MNLGLCVSGSDAPARLLTDEDYDVMGSVGNVNEAEHEAELALQTFAEAPLPKVEKGTKVDVDLGIFDHAEVTEINGDMFFVVRNADGEFVLVSVEPKTRQCGVVVPSLSGPPRGKSEVLSAVKLQLAKTLLSLSRRVVT